MGGRPAHLLCGGPHKRLGLSYPGSAHSEEAGVYVPCQVAETPWAIVELIAHRTDGVIGDIFNLDSGPNPQSVMILSTTQADAVSLLLSGDDLGYHDTL